MSLIFLLGAFDVKINKIGLMGAMTEEIALFSQYISQTTTEELAGITFVLGAWDGIPIVLCKSGVGKVNAAICAQLLIQKYEVECILFTGVAGAVNPNLEIGDVVISTDCMHHDMDVTALGFTKGIIPFASQSIFPANPALVEEAFQAGEQLYPGNISRGRVLSGDQFIANRNKVRELHQNFQGDCVEMEGAAVGQVCHMNQVPFVILRSMSDKADGSAHMNFTEFTQLASERSAALVQRMILRLK
jgi:adenosylhomocysteine nucleosidase